MKRKVLIAEDNAINRKMLHHILDSEYDVIEAQNGTETLDCLRNDGISAVLLDIGMPEMDGYQVLRHMHENAAMSQIPVVVTTGSQDEEAEVKALSLGAKDFVSKPYNPVLILHCVRSAINGRETASLINAIQRDKLTSLYNREAFFDRVIGMIREKPAGFYVMASIDVNNFKLINDQYGAEQGDAVLRHIGTLLEEGMQSIGGVGGRISGDNFAALYPMGEAEMETVERLRDAMGKPPNTPAAVTCCVGRYVVSDTSLSANTIYDRAYIAKQSIKGRYDRHLAYFDDSMLEALKRRQEIVDDMNAALAERQFEAWLQPQYNHATGALIGAEALARWRHPKRGLIPPSEFIPLFEQNGFVYELDKYIWEEVCIALRQWRDEGRNPLPVSVNISRYDVLRADVIDVLNGLLEKYDLPVELLRLEITESAFAEAGGQVISVVRKLIERGFTVEIDDFGSGYSSLNTLKDVPASVLKLDMRFLEGNGNAPRGGSILESMVRMAKWLNMSVIAEGVESMAQADFLKSIGCTYIQGYLYARPMPRSEYEALAVGVNKEQRLLSMTTVEHLDNNVFWDPRSMETLIFNSYIGGACIFEYHDHKIEMIRANDKFIGAFGNLGLSVEEALKLDWVRYMAPENAAALDAALHRSYQNNEETSAEVVFRGLPKTAPVLYMNVTYRVIAAMGERYLVYSIQENITDRKLAEQSLYETDEALRFLNDIAHDLLAQPNSVKALNTVLSKLLTYFGGSTAHIFEIHGGWAVGAYEVGPEGASAGKGNRRKISGKVMETWLELFKEQSYLYVPDITEYAPCCEEEKQNFLALGIRSMIAAPIRRDGAVIGVIGIDNPTRQYDRVSRIAALGDYIAVMLTRRDLSDKLSKEGKALLEFMNDIPGGFARKLVEKDGDIKHVYFNEGFYQMVGMKKLEALALFGKDFFQGVHPEDVGVVKDLVRRVIRYGEAVSPKYRLRSGVSGYLWVTVYGRMTRNAAGQVFLNLYYTKATAQLKEEEEMGRFLDELPCGAALLEYRGHALDELHFNQKYLDMLGRPNANPAHVTLLNPMHPDDQTALTREVVQAAREKRDVVSEVRILYGNEDTYRVFHLRGRVVPREDGGYYVIALYTPMEGDASAYQEMLPLALNAVIGASQDMVFVKDRFLRYVCCSKPYYKALNLKDEQDVVGKTDYDLVSKEDADRYREGDRQIFQTGRARLDFDEERPGPNGTVRYVTTSKYPLLDAGKNVIGIYTVSRDVTKAHNTDSQLKLLTDNIPGGLAVYRYASGSVKTLYFNEGCVRLLGYTTEEYKKIALTSSVALVYPDDVPGLREKLEEMLHSKDTMEHTCRVRAKDGSLKWIEFRARVSERKKNAVTLNTVLMDMTNLRETVERLRVSEEENRLAVLHSGTAICRLDVAQRIVTMNEEYASVRGLPLVLEDVPYAQVRQGQVSSDTADAYVAFFESIFNGEPSASVTFMWQKDIGWRWLEARASTIYTADGKPLAAVISYMDISEQVEKETVYKRWQQSLQDKKPEEYTLLRCNISKGVFMEKAEGSLLRMKGIKEQETFDACTRAYALAYVYEEDRAWYINALNMDTLLAGYYRGKHNHIMEYRELKEGGGERWLRLSIDLVEYPNSSDVEAYMMFTDIDRKKREKLNAAEKAEKDPLTGALNRATFVARVEQQIADSAPGEKHALLMLDVDGFKMVNDVLGHGVGDQVLIDIVNAMHSVLRQDDLLGRLGGDEFVAFLTNIPDDAVVVGKAKQICALVRKTYNGEVQISSSIGIAICPRDGLNFDTLYHKADTALYRVKDTGKDSYSFYRENAIPMEEAAPSALPGAQRKQRMLIVDSDAAEAAFLQETFINEFLMEKTKDTKTGLIRLRHYGLAISAVLLSLSVSERECFDFLQKMQSHTDMRAIPVILIGKEDDRRISMKALQSGAAYYLTQPLDRELLQIRVTSAIHRAKSDQSRGQSRMDTLEREKVATYRLALERMRVAVVGHDWIKGTFSYDATLPKLVAGAWDERSLWHVLMSDLVADVATVKEIQTLVYKVAQGKEQTAGSMAALLKTPSREKHWFRIDVFKDLNEYQLTNMIIITLRDVGIDAPDAS